MTKRLLQFTFLLSLLFSLNKVQAQVNVTFKVNMYYEQVSDSGIHIAGTFNNWNPDSTLLVNVGGSDYEVTLSLPADSVYEYKFINGNGWGEDEILTSNFCTDITGQNRLLPLGTNDTTLLNVCFGTCYTCSIITPINITFKVDMSQVANISTNGVHLAGNFQGWDPAATEMTDMGAGMYEATVSMNPNQIIEYKFINGNAWGNDESVPSACANILNNRELTIYNFNLTLGPVCYGECGVCVPPVVVDSANITFAVDMQYQTVSDSGVYIAGDFQGWNASLSEMSNTSGSIYSATFKLPVNTSYEYKFINGNDWIYDEDVPAACDQNLNRVISFSNADTILSPVCFSSCTACSPIIPIDSVNITFQVDMAQQTVSTNGVHIAGNFQGFDPSTNIMNQVGTSSVYSATFSLPVNATYEFKFINGNAWGTDESVPALCATGFNRSVSIGSNDTVLAPVCFASCTACVPVVIPDSVSVTFKVDMTGLTISPNGVHLAGNFQGWNPTSTLMNNIGGNIYSVTVLIPENYSCEYKFINGAAFGEDESVPSVCATNSNRGLQLQTFDVVLPPVCFGSCNPCPPSNVVNVTFQVDLGTTTPNSLGVHIASEFQGWNPAATQLTLAGGTVYQYTTALESGDTIEYKYINGKVWSLAEIIPASCTLDQIQNNRFLIVPAVNTLLPVVCFAACEACQLGTENISLNSFEVSPTLTNGLVTISLSQNINTIIEVLNISGQVILKQNMTSNSNSISLSNYPDGIYFIRVVGSNNVGIEKVVLSK
jgi:hypothetical protein